MFYYHACTWWPKDQEMQFYVPLSQEDSLSSTPSSRALSQFWTLQPIASVHLGPHKDKPQKTTMMILNNKMFSLLLWCLHGVETLGLPKWEDESDSFYDPKVELSCFFVSRLNYLPSLRETNHTELGPTLVTSFQFDYLCKGNQFDYLYKESLKAWNSAYEFVNAHKIIRLQPVP